MTEPRPFTLRVSDTVLSLQFLQVPVLREHAWLGNLLVLPAAACLVLAVMFALPPYRELQASDATRAAAWWLAAAACVGVMSFQLVMMWLVSGRLHRQ